MLGGLQFTAGSLDATKLRRIREIIYAKFGMKRCAQDKDAREKFKKAIGQKCKHLPYKQL